MLSLEEQKSFFVSNGLSKFAWMSTHLHGHGYMSVHLVARHLYAELWPALCGVLSLGGRGTWRLWLEVLRLVGWVWMAACSSVALKNIALFTVSPSSFWFLLQVGIRLRPSPLRTAWAAAPWYPAGYPGG